jgi:hypothetical protein
MDILISASQETRGLEESLPILTAAILNRLPEFFGCSVVLWLTESGEFVDVLSYHPTKSDQAILQNDQKL